LKHLGQTEVQQLHRAVRPQLDVGRLQITVHDATLVCRFERVRDLSCDRDGVVDCNRSGRDAVGQRRALDQLEDQRMHSVGCLQPVDGGDVGVIHRREDLCFAGEASESVPVFPFVCLRRRQHLYRDVASKVGIVCAIHLSHPAASDECDDSQVSAKDLTGTESIRDQPDRAVKPPMRRGIGAQHAVNLGGERSVAVAGAFDETRPLCGRPLRGRFEDVARAVKPLRVARLERFWFGHDSCERNSNPL
jgi:hypothetical protein